MIDPIHVDSDGYLLGYGAMYVELMQPEVFYLVKYFKPEAKLYPNTLVRKIDNIDFRTTQKGIPSGICLYQKCQKDTKNILHVQ